MLHLKLLENQDKLNPKQVEGEKITANNKQNRDKKNTKYQKTKKLVP
jgi:hypothetical protein